MISEKVRQLLNELPEGVELLAAAKSRKPSEILEAISGGVQIIGENYVQEAEKARAEIKDSVKWHFIGHLQKNKVKKAVHLFDMIETVDSLEIANEIDIRAGEAGKVMPVLIEVNSGREKQKSGVFPEEAEFLIKQLSPLNNIKIAGLMTMGPRSGAPEDFRAYFRETKKLFNRLKRLKQANLELKYLSMGMTDSYRVAIEEGANIIRIGSKIFGKRPDA